MSPQRAHRLWRKAGLQLPRRRPRHWVATSRPRPVPASAANRVRAYDFMSAPLFDVNLERGIEGIEQIVEGDVTAANGCAAAAQVQFGVRRPKVRCDRPLERLSRSCRRARCHDRQLDGREDSSESRVHST